MKIALYPGSFDPITNGHLDVIHRAARLFDKLIVAVGINHSKKTIFSVDERLGHLKRVCKGIGNVEVSSFSGLLASAVERYGAHCVVRGLRAVSDFEWEFQMALMNRELSERCETIFLMPSPEYSFVSSTMIREIASLGGEIESFVPETIAGELKEHLQQR